MFFQVKSPFPHDDLTQHNTIRNANNVAMCVTKPSSKRSWSLTTCMYTMEKVHKTEISERNLLPKKALTPRNDHVLQHGNRLLHYINVVFNYEGVEAAPTPVV
jgi:hypothetical protein